MNNLTLQTQAQIAGGVALLCLVFGAAAWEIAAGRRKWLGRATIAGGVLQLMAFSHHAVGQYQVILATTQIPLVEVASGDSGRERTIERIECPNGLLFEREYYPGWRTVSADRRGQPASGAVLRRTNASACCGGQAQGSTGGIAGSFCGCLEVSGCCDGQCEHCWCNPATRLSGSSL